MHGCGRLKWVHWVGLGLLLAGCSASPPPSYPAWAPAEKPFAPAESSSNAFDGYTIAARMAEDATEKYNNRVYFTPGQRLQVVKACGPALALVRRSSAKHCDFRFVSQPPFALSPNHIGWRMIRNSLAWQIDSNVAAKNFDVAVSLTILASKVGFDLSGGAAKDADLGLQMVDDARRAITPVLPDLSPNQLSALTSGLKAALERKPDFTQVVENERLNMLQAVQMVQDCYQKDDFTVIRTALGNEVRDAIDFLKQIKRDDAKKRPAYFEGFVEEANAICESMRKKASLPMVKRTEDLDPVLAESRPWRRFSKQFFEALGPALEKEDACIARTRLLILTSEIYRQIKVAKQAPRNLGGFSRDLTLDPYTGQPFKYRSNGTEFYLYSAGANFQDDQGATDSTFSSPDLTLETGRR